MKPIVDPDVKNESQEYWEEVLNSHGLGRTKTRISEDLLDQPICDINLEDIDGLRQIEIENE
jgi:hypothetical protein